MAPLPVTLSDLDVYFYDINSFKSRTYENVAHIGTHLLEDECEIILSYNCNSHNSSVRTVQGHGRSHMLNMCGK